MIDKFLNAKHWQLFLMVFGLPFIFQFIIMFSAIAEMNNQGELDLEEFSNIMMFAQIIAVLIMYVWFGWFWSIGIGLQDKKPDGVKMNVRKFKVFFFIPLMYISFISIVTFTFLQEMPHIFVLSATTSGVGGIILIHFFSMFCIFYVMYFAAKTFKTVELQKEVKFSDFVGEFFLLWFFPIGVWFLQPKINKLMDEEDEFL